MAATRPWPTLANALVAALTLPGTLPLSATVARTLSLPLALTLPGTLSLTLALPLAFTLALALPAAFGLLALAGLIALACLSHFLPPLAKLVGGGVGLPGSGAALGALLERACGLLQGLLRGGDVAVLQGFGGGGEFVGQFAIDVLQGSGRFHQIFCQLRQLLIRQGG